MIDAFLSLLHSSCVKRFRVLSLQVRSGGTERELIWNEGEGLQRSSGILQNATRARVSVDAQGRRTLSMLALGDQGGVGVPGSSR